MEEEKGSQRRRRDCGYQYMMPSYALDEDEPDAAANYLIIADALLENSSAHGLPTFYRARGFQLRFFPTDCCRDKDIYM